MEAQELKSGDLVQIDPEKNEKFGGCIAVVSEPKSFGAQAYVQIPGDGGGPAYFRPKWEDMELVGSAVWTLP